MRKYQLTKAYPKRRDAQKRIFDFHPIYHDFDAQEAMAQASRCIQCPVDIMRGLQSEFHFCRTGCPLNNEIPKWLKKTYDGDILGAFELSNARSPFPEILGRVCPKQGLCESSCTLEKTPHHAVSIGNIEVYLNETAFENHAIPSYSHPNPTPYKVAVVGGGPAGLSCATFLMRMGISVEIFEKEDKVGGLLTYGIPNFKLPKHTILRRVEWMKEAGLKVHYHTEVGKDVSLQSLKEKFDAIFLGMGTPLGRQSGMENEYAKGVHHVMELLMLTQKNLFNHNFHEAIFENKHVVVIGGGNSAMDALRTAIRHRAKRVTCVYRRDEAHMPSSALEIAYAKEEGVEFLFSHAPKRAILNDNHHVIGVDIVKTYMNEAGKLCYNEEEHTCIKADSIILALGFDAQKYDFFDALHLDYGRAHTLVVNENKETSHPFIFAGGDMVRGANLVVNAALDGRTAALGIAQRLGVAKENLLYM